VIDIEKACFRYPGSELRAVDELSLHIPAGRLFGLLGPNGSGKTTLISLLVGLLSADSGMIRIDGNPMPSRAREVRRFIGLTPQDYAFYPRLTVRENLQFFAGALQLRGAQKRERMEAAVGATALQSFRGKRAQHLSGGLKRRLNLAIGLLNRPRLLILDEPTVGVDPQSRHFILQAIGRINDAGTTIIYTSHYMEEVEQLCDDIAVLDAGRLLAHGTLRELVGDTGDNLEALFLRLTGRGLRD
jgi:ABC-2 type transport system ATP-binding protein